MECVAAAGGEIVVQLTKAQEMLKQCDALLNHPAGAEKCKALVSEILSCVDKAKRVAKASDSGAEFNESPHSENSNQSQPFKERLQTPKKRKTMPKWTSQIRVGAGEGIDSPLGDGFSWRKYGQKDILGAKFPRGYFRCSHRNSGCLAMKQVQRSDENPSVFEVTYRGDHTCHQRRQIGASPEPELKQNQNRNQLINQVQEQQQQQDLLHTFQTNLIVKTEGLGSESQDVASPSFSFPSTPISSLNPDNPIFLSSETGAEKCFLASLSPSFVSPATSESNYFSVSECRMSTYGGWAGLPEPDFPEIISASTSTTSSPMMDMDFMLDPLELDHDFSTFFS